MTAYGGVALHDQRGPANGPVLVLGPSLGTTGRLWQPQIGALARTYRVIRYDYAGHGGVPSTPGPYTIDGLGRSVLALLDGLGVERFSYAGVSIGGMVGMWLASEVPERVERLALLCTSALLGPQEKWHDRAATVRTKGMEAIADGVVAGWFTPAFAARRPEVVAGYRGMLAGAEPEGYAGCCEAIAAMDLRDRLDSITAPTLVLAGADDHATSPDHAEAIVQRVSGARLEVVPDAAHLPGVEQPEMVRRLLAAHLDAAQRDDDRHRRGMAVRRDVLGAAHVDAAVARTDAFTTDFQDLITRYAWGDLWSRDGIDRKTRRLVTIALLAAVGHDNEVAMHVRAAVRCGVTAAEIREALLHVAVYAGVPAANTAFRIAQAVLAEDQDNG